MVYYPELPFPGEAMLRMHLTAADLTSIHLVTTFGPLAETLFSIETLNRRRPGALYAGCRTGQAGPPPPGGPPLGGLADFLAFIDLQTVVGQSSSIEQGTEALLAQAPSLLRDEICHAAWAQAVSGRGRAALRWPAWIHGLPGDGRVRRQLAAALRERHDADVGPHWARIRAHLHAERAARARVLAEGGVQQLLTTLHPQLRWRPPYLEVLTLPGCWRDLPADGRGITLVPSVFSRSVRVYESMSDHDQSLVVFFPALRELGEAERIWQPVVPGGPGGALAALLGQTRAAALAAVRDGCTTTELAGQLAVAPATASHHAAVLRNAGLITTRRLGSAVIHTLTDLGASVLHGATALPSPATRDRPLS